MLEPLASVLALFAVAFGLAGWTYKQRKDILDPCVVFLPVYALFTSGPVLWYLYSGWMHPAIVLDNVAPVLRAVAGALVAFWVGATVGRRGVRFSLRPRRPRGERSSAGLIALPPVRTTRLVQVLAWVTLLAYTVIGYRLHQVAGGQKVYIWLTGSWLLRSYYVLAAVLIVLAFCYAAFDADKKQGRVGWGIVLFLVFYAIACFQTGERDVIIPAGGWAILNAPYWSRRRIVGLVGVLVLFLTLVPIVRMAGLGLSDQGAAMANISFEQFFKTLATSNSPNLMIFTRVMDWVPLQEGFRYGDTYLQALLTFVPGVEVGESPLIWFKEKVTPGGLSGFGFALDAEAYLNFGLLGPVLFFAVWGWFLGFLFRRVRRGAARSYDKFLYAYVLMVSIFSIRADFRGFSKLVVYGAVIGWVIYVASPRIARRYRRTRNAAAGHGDTLQGV